jgi:hypothetical protein
VEPYDFASDQALGTTVSAPAYDRSVDPPVLLGVVAMDITIAALKKASGVHDESVIFELIQELVDRSVPKDSNIQLDNCTLESLRYHDDKYNATCSNLCINITIFGVKECTNVTYPEFTLNNKNLSSKTYTYQKRACCHVNSSYIVMGSSDVCIDPMFPRENKTNHEESSNPISSALTSSLVVLGLFVFLGVAFFLYKQKENFYQINAGDPLRVLPGKMLKNENSLASSISNVVDGDRAGSRLTTSESKKEKVLPAANEISMTVAIADRDGGLEMASNALPEKLSLSGKSFTSSTSNYEEVYCGRINNRMKHNRTSSVGTIEAENEEETILVRADELFTKAKVADRSGE